MKKIILTLLLLVVGSLMFQSFQCASPEFTSAKVALQNKEFDKAEGYLVKETNKNPANDEAWFLLAETRLSKVPADVAGAIEAVNKAEANAKTPNVIQRIPGFKYNIWVQLVNESYQEVNSFYTDKDMKHADKIIKNLDLADQIRPKQPEPKRVKAMAHEMKKDTIAAVKEYENFSALIADDIQFAKENQFYLEYPRAKMLSKFKEHKNEYSGIQGNGDSIYIDRFTIEGNDLFVHSYKSPKNEQAVVSGWDYNPPKEWMPGERMQSNNIRIDPFGALAQFYFNKQEYKESLDNIMTISAIDPSNEDANSFMVQIYQVQGKTEEALAVIGDLIKAYPDNKFYLSQYGEIYFQLQRYDESINAFERALKIDPSYPEALRNLASSYKNKAVVLQNAQTDKMTADKTYKGNPEEYFPFLRKSADYFTKSLQTNKYEDDFRLLGELYNIYYVLNEQNKAEGLISQLENLEPTIDRSSKAEYYLILIKIYSNKGDDAKLRRAEAEFNKFK